MEWTSSPQSHDVLSAEAATAHISDNAVGPRDRFLKRDGDLKRKVQTVALAA